MSYFIDDVQRNLEGGKNTPLLSNRLDSVRTYQWEVNFETEAATDRGEKIFTLGAKQVSQSGFQVEDIEVHRGNDRYYYPGKASMDELVITFDNQYKSLLSTKLFNLMQDTYDPETGAYTRNVNQANANNVLHKFKIVVNQLDGAGNLSQRTQYIGAYIKSWKQAEFNYATNEFHTIECTFRYDFILQDDARV